MKTRPELLAPVQDWKTLRTLNGLADAIYFGVKQYNMRAKAKNFKRIDLKAIAEYCHDQQPKMNAYLCTNILIYDSELRDLEDLILDAKDADIDAIIAHDLAAIKIAKKCDIKFHISTQANISNIQSAKFYEDLGAERIVLARELSLNQIRNIKSHLKKTKVECFVHGSMCTSISGRCYFSATLNNSEKYSANRGNCVQSCRREWKVIDDQNKELIYDGQLFLNAKDLCMIEYIPELINAEIDALKIEGRMKDPLYVKTVLECYKEALDCYFNGTFTQNKVITWIERLSKIYNRGFHTGFYFQKPTVKEIELLKRGNVSPYKKLYLGKVLSFDKKSMSANVLIETKELPLQLGDELIINGKEFYHTEKVKKIILNGQKISIIKREGDSSPIKINLPLSKELKSNEKIYIISNT